MAGDDLPEETATEQNRTTERPPRM